MMLVVGIILLVGGIVMVVVREIKENGDMR